MIDTTRLWPCVFGVLTIVGVIAALITLPFTAMVALGIGVALAGPTLYCGYRKEYRPGTSRALPAPTVRQLVNGGGLAGAGAVATAGYIAMAGPIGLLVVIVLMASPVGRSRPGRTPEPERLGSPPPEPIAVATVGTPPRPAPAPAPASTPTSTSTPTPAPAPAPARSWPLLDDADLCRAWRVSFTALQHCPPHDDPTPLVETRRQLLDELARRDPAGFDRWLDAGARAASNPHPFLTSMRSAPRPSPRLPLGLDDRPDGER